MRPATLALSAVVLVQFAFILMDGKIEREWERRIDGERERAEFCESRIEEMDARIEEVRARLNRIRKSHETITLWSDGP